MRRARDEALKLGRMTREDAEQLASVFVQVSSRQARDTLAGLQRRVGRALAKRRS